MNRKLIIAINVVLFHVAALWALQNGLLRRAMDIIVPAEIISEFVTPAVPAVTLPMPAPPTAPAPAPRKPTVAPTPAPVATPAVEPQLAVQTEQAAAPISVAPAQPAAPGPVAAAPAPAPTGVELPSSAADYLQNPKPPYPAISKRLGEQGKVVVRVLIGADGTPQRAEISQSSGFDRLDQAALATVLRWRYVPGKLGGVAQAMWFNVPINFVLE